MNTLKTTVPLSWTAKEQTKHENFNLIKKFNRFADGQKENHTLWWFVNLMVHGTLILAIPAVLIYYYNAPVIVLAITIACFFSTFVANMCGSGIRTTLATFFISLLVHAVMILLVVFL
ncbi:hypothetical protein [Mucilaginibacter aquaedulcis]|jgi:hypothetical protein|uniref:hypothetical protein n=1 Tax=Mucilaginibacter aquaedulcis TaxID=1187081 RepID=UPI0025B4E6F0|nr:hypothetical protein [Mucilaginibacter aquaedulcis]MDN3550140.1 hypothetical protein [Mucilaginibacter aquaedulcis]